MTSYDPEVAVFMIGTNDANVVNSQDAHDDGDRDWRTEYRRSSRR